MGLGEPRRNGTPRLSYELGTLRAGGRDIPWQRSEALLAVPAVLRDSWKLFGVASLRWVGLDDPDRALPARLMRPGVGAIAVGRHGDYRWFLLATAAFNSDLHRLSWDATDLALTGTLSFPLRDRWRLVVGLRWSTGIRPRLPGLRYVTLPALQAIWSPDPSFQLRLGSPSTALHWRPSPRFEVEAAYNIAFGGQLRFSHQVLERLRIREFIGRSFDSFQLSESRHPERSAVLLEKWGAGAQIETGFRVGSGQPLVLLSAGYEYAFAGSLWFFDYERGRELEELKIRQGHAGQLLISAQF